MSPEASGPASERLPPWGPWLVRVLFLSAALALPIAQWPTSRMGSAFLLVCGLALVVSTLGLAPSWLRLVRLVASGATTVAGAVLTLQLGWMMDHPTAGDPAGLSGALVIAVAMGGLGVWTSDLRITRAADDAADARHEELLATFRDCHHDPERSQANPLEAAVLRANASPAEESKLAEADVRAARIRARTADAEITFWHDGLVALIAVDVAIFALAVSLFTENQRIASFVLLVASAVVIGLTLWGYLFRRTRSIRAWADAQAELDAARKRWLSTSQSEPTSPGHPGPPGGSAAPDPWC